MITQKRYRSGMIALMLAVTSCSTQQRQQQPAPPQRIVSVVPSVTEMLFAFGLGDRIVAVSDYDQFPPEVAAKERVGGLLNPNVEGIIKLNPDLVIVYGSQNVLRERLEGIGIPLQSFEHGNLEQTLQYMLELGRVLQTEPAAEALTGEIREQLEDIRSQAPSVRPRVLLTHNREVGTLGSIYTVGSLAFQHDLITIAGGDNIFGDVAKEVIQPSLEEIISRAPDVIIETVPADTSSDQATQRKKDWLKLKLPAVVNDQVYIVSDDALLVPGPRLHLAARRLSQIFRSLRSTPSQ